MPAILVCTSWYLPGSKAGGPIRSIANLMGSLAADFSFRVATRDRDLGDPLPFPLAAAGGWQRLGESDIRYLAPGERGFRSFLKIIREADPSLIYCNSFFEPVFTIKLLLLRRAGILPVAPLVIAPRGELDPAALAFKGVRKRLYILAARGLGLLRNVVWQATCEEEAAHVRERLGSSARVVVIPNLPSADTIPLPPPRPAKEAGTLRVVFLSRIARKKNLDGAIEMLRGVTGRVEFTIYGPREDEAYWGECAGLMATLPANVTVRHGGILPHDQVAAALAGHDLFFFPTRGENFGHVILEALLAGLPVLLSDRTPWRRLEEAGAGWDLDLSDREGFRAVIDMCVAMNGTDFARMSTGARELGSRYVSEAGGGDAMRRLFRDLIAGNPSSAQVRNSAPPAKY
jgi:glycosyltransferase involved in cell wall biosynthesis